jgi:hypothetical protein
VLCPPDVDCGGSLRIVLRAVDVGPRGGVQDEVEGLEPCRWRRADIPVVVRERDDLVGRERLDERTPQLPARAGYKQAARSRSDRIGDCVLQRCLTR